MLNFNGIDFSNNGIDFRVAAVKRPLIAPQSLSTTKINGRAADVFHHKIATAYQMDIDFYLFSTNSLQLSNDLRTLAEMIDSEQPAPLIFSDESDKWIHAILLQTDNFERHGNYAKGTISFYAHDPYWYAVNDDIFTYTANGTYNFNRQGNATSYPLIEIFGTTGQYTLNVNGVEMTFTGTINTGEKLVIDSTLLTAYILGSDGVTKTSVINKLDKLNFPVLNKGANTFSISTADGAQLTECKITCNSRWK